MKTTIISLFFVTLVSPALVMSQQATKSTAPKAPGIEQQLIQLESEWQRTSLKKDAAGLSRLIAEDWVGTNEKGKIIHKEQFIATIISNHDTVTHAENYDLQVRVYGTTAVVTGASRENGIRNGAAYFDDSRWTDVFVKLDNRWQAVASQWVNVQ